MPVSPSLQSSELVSFAILSEGRSIPDYIETVSIKVSQNISGQNEAIMVIKDGLYDNFFKPNRYPKSMFDITDSKTFEIGSNIEIKLGYHSKNKSIFKGTIAQQNIIIDQKFNSQNGGSQLQILCKSDVSEIAPIDFQKVDFSREAALEINYGEDVLEANLCIDQMNTGDINLDVNDQKFAPVKGHITFQGTTLAQVGDSLKLEQFGHRFGFYGISIISGITHIVENGQWLTKVNLGSSN